MKDNVFAAVVIIMFFILLGIPYFDKAIRFQEGNCKVTDTRCKDGIFEVLIESPDDSKDWKSTGVLCKE